MLYVSLVASVVLVLVLLLLRRFARSLLSVTMGGLLIPVVAMGSGVLLLNWALLLVVAMICDAAQVSTRRFAIALMGATLVAYVAFAPRLYTRERELAALRRDYPLQSLRARLADMHRHQFTPDVRVPESRGADDTETLAVGRGVRERDLQELECKLEQARHEGFGRRRVRALPALLAAHEGVVSEFVNSPGFGITRTIRLPAQREYIELPEPVPMAIDVGPQHDKRHSAEEPADDEPSIVPVHVAGEAGGDGAEVQTLGDFHGDSVINFSNAPGFGYVGRDWQDGKGYFRNLDRVVGFQAHAFRSRPTPPTVQSSTWQIAELQLVSLLKHDTPVAYVSDKLPRMEDLRDNPTRPLAGFETTALERLRSGEDLVVSEHPNTIHMLGSIRALRQCLDCHQVERGALLGAFSYRLRREPAQAAPPAVKPAGKSLSATTGQPDRGHSPKT